MITRAFVSVALLAFSVRIAQPQSSVLTCASGAVNPPVRAEGVTEILGDIVLTCSGGTPGAAMSVNLAIFLNVGVTNRVTTSGATDVSLTIDTGSGPIPVSVPGVLQTSSSVSFNGLSFTIPPTGAVSFRVSNLRGNVSQLGVGSQRPVLATLSINGVPSTIVGATTPLSVGIPAQGLLASYADTGIRCTGSPLPSTFSFSSLFGAGTRFASTRVTEGFPTAFEVRSAKSDTGIRILARYSGFPAGARLFVPTAVAGSDAAQPTAAGDLGGTPSGGAYAPGGSGSLLLSLVNGTDANGAGGTLAYTPGAPGSGTVTFDSVAEVRLTNGGGLAVYEVVDASPNVRESAQFPTFIGLPSLTNGSTPIASEQVSFAPVTTVPTASTTDPVPRFLAIPPASDCPALADCNANYFPALSVNASQPLQFTAIAGSALQTKTVQVNNRGGGVMSWTASFVYSSGANWLTINPGAGVNGGTVLVNVFPQNIGPGVYNATLIIDAGPQSGSKTLPITLTVTALPTLPAPPAVVTPPPAVLLQTVSNAARPDSAAVSPGSLAIIKGAHLQGKNVSVTFDGISATILSADDNSIEILLPASLASGAVTQLQVTVDADKSAPLAVSISELAPAIFSNGILNEDFSANTQSNPAAAGSTLHLLSTGLIGANPGPVMVKLHDRQLNPQYAGPLPGWVGVNQVDVIIPDDLPAMTTEAAVCGYGAAHPSQPICSLPVNVTLQTP
jgi:uncharacterized protein (TIGR03437 family)